MPEQDIFSNGATAIMPLAYLLTIDGILKIVLLNGYHDVSINRISISFSLLPLNLCPNSIFKQSSITRSQI